MLFALTGCENCIIYYTGLAHSISFKTKQYHSILSLWSMTLMTYVKMTYQIVGVGHHFEEGRVVVA